MEAAGRCQGGPELPWRSWVATRGMESKWLYSPSPWGLMVDAQPARSCPGELGGHQGREEQPMVHLPHGSGRQPPGRPGAVLGSWEATRGGKSSRWYIFSMEAAGSRPAGPELPWEASGYQENREQTDVLSST